MQPSKDPQPIPIFKTVALWLLLTLPISIFAQSPPSDSLIQKYRKEVRKFMRQAGFNGGVFFKRNVDKNIFTLSMAYRLISILNSDDFIKFHGDGEFYSLPRVAFDNHQWDMSLVERLKLLEIPFDSSRKTFYKQFGFFHPFWSYSAPIFSRDWQWCVFSYHKHPSKSLRSNPNVILYKKAWWGWRKFKNLNNPGTKRWK